jgi:hypothetical protein
MFRVDDGEMTLSPNAIDGTTKLIVHVQTLEAGLGEGRIEYVFGYRAHKLFQVNVVWGLDTNPQLSNREMLAAALRLQLYFLGYTWANRSARSGIPMDGSTVMLFSGADRNNRAVILTIEGVRYEFDRNGVIRLQPERLAPTRLTVSYAAASSESDVRTVSREEF